jgi:predicted phage-related endonuclease|tara:strand:+ start:5014 stop:5985 length:972 start_codon:yes stop_codon:yes gene_type:complete
MNQEERQAWLTERKKGLGGTDIACIMMAGADTSEKIGSFENSLFKIWSEKTGLFESEDQDNAILMRGRVMEKYVCEFYELHLGKGCNLWEEGLTWHPNRPRIFGTPDRLVEQNGIRFGMDAKTRRFRKGWGDSGTTDIPLDVEFQMRVYMEIFDTPYWDIATLFGLDDFRVYRLERDKDLGESILDVAEAWWKKHVDGEIPPDVDATDQCMKVLGQLNSRVKDEPLREATVAEKDLYEKIIKVKTEYKEIQIKKKQLENLLRSKIGDSPGIKGVATWNKSKNTKTFDKRSFQEAEPKMYEKYVIEKEGTRMLRVKEPKNDNSA